MEENGSLYIIDVSLAFRKHAAYLELDKPCRGIDKVVASYVKDGQTGLGAFRTTIVPRFGVTKFLRDAEQIKLVINEASGSVRTLPLDLTGSKDEKLVYTREVDLRGRMPVNYEIQIAIAG